MEQLTVQVRQHKDGELYAFFYEGGRLACFCFSEGHSECCDEWRLNDCKPVSKSIALNFSESVENSYNFNGDIVKVRSVQKLNISQV